MICEVSCSRFVNKIPNVKNIKLFEEIRAWIVFFVWNIVHKVILNNILAATFLRRAG